MKAATLTVSLFGDDKHPEYRVDLRAGAPWDKSDTITFEHPADFWQVRGISESELQAGAWNPTVGKAVGQFLFPTSIREAWTALGNDLRTYLHLGPKLDHIPWETAELPSGQSAFLNSATPFVRYCEKKRSVARPVPDRLVVLVVVSVAGDGSTIGADRELRFLREAIRPVDRLIDMRVLVNPTAEKLSNALLTHKPSIFHFIGHGKAGELKLWTGQQYEPWSVRSIGEDLDNAKWVPELVYLNACRSYDGKEDTEGTGRTWSVSGGFLEKGASAVLAMQGPVSGEASGVVARELYQRLAAGVPLDVATAAARYKLSRDPNYSQTRDPYLPALVVCHEPESLLSHSCCNDSGEWIDRRSYRSIISNCEILVPAVAEFIDRDEERWKLLNRFAECAQKTPASIVVGPSGIGKTWLLAWCIDGWLRRRRQVRYVKMSGCSNWLELLRRIRDGALGEPGVVFEPLPRDIVDELTWRWNGYSKSRKVLPRPQAATNVEDRVPELSKIKRKVPEFYVDAFGALAEVLDQNPDRVSYILVLDEFKTGSAFFPTEDFDYLVKHFIKARLLTGSTRVHVVVSLSDDPSDSYNALLPGVIPRLEVPAIRPLPDYIRMLYKIRYKQDLTAFFEEKLQTISRNSFTGEELRRALQNIKECESLLNPR